MAIQIPEKLAFLFYPARYKVARGGRGSAKSWSFARALLRKGIEKKLRILCAREVQNSIADSVHALLKSQIELLELQGFYTVKDEKIIGINGTLFRFVGLSSLTVNNVKSYEDFDIAWVAEAQNISKRSWQILTPTIRAPGSEIWIEYNPELETDETHQRFTINQPTGTVNVEINWRDNPWFTKEMENERLDCKRDYPDDYDWIWEGKCKPAVSGAIYYKQIQEAETNGRICNVPHDPMLKTHIIVDLGWEDSLATCLVQKHLSEIRIIDYLECNHTDWPEWSKELRTRPCQWGKVWLPHDGFAKTLNSKGKSTYDILSDGLGWDVAAKEEITFLGVEEGIRATRMHFPQIYFDKEKCNATKPPEINGNFKHTDRSNRLIECLKRYRRHINNKTDSTSTPVRDPNAHGADCMRYVAINSDNMHNEETAQIRIPGQQIAGMIGANPGGWMQI